jgi:hypothetical protein
VSDTFPQDNSANIGAIFAQLNQQEVEEFYIGYQYWNLQRQVENLQIRLSDVRKQLLANTEQIQGVQPTAIELATLARLQSNGVNDVDLLDRMLERGESWLDRTMQRLDYLEQLDDFISDEYTQWCQHALEGAYDWIDTVLDGNAPSQPSTITISHMMEDVKEEKLVEATEELILQKITTDEDESFMQEITTKRPSITPAGHEEVVTSTEDTHAGIEDAAPLENTSPIIEETNPAGMAEDTNNSKNEEDTHTGYIAPEESLAEESSSTSTNEHPAMQEPVELSPGAQQFSSSQTNATLKHVSSKGPNIIERFFGRIWGS